MIISIYLNSLRAFQEIPEVQACFDKAALPNNVDSLRGELLRTLDKVMRLKQSDKGVIGQFSHYIRTFFTSGLENMSMYRLQQLENAIITALQGLAVAHPLGNDDPIDLMPIEEDELYLQSLTGRKYLLENLINWVQVRKNFIYPDLNIPMLPKDKENLIALSRQHGFALFLSLDYTPQLQNALDNAGITAMDLKDLQVPQLRVNHIRTLSVLKSDHGLSLTQAINEIQNLNYEQVVSLQGLYAKGLRGHHLRNLHIDESDYGPHHTAVLHILIDEHGYHVEQAVEAITACDFAEVQKFYAMLSPF